ncbi:MULTISPECIES: hypothetical protein [Ralstonia]|uniref:hypothetical protein n=1 Tax=Ralstonia TaxID=48736 RepID=UPI00066B3885|nr:MULTISPECIES: hypothetical protein [Ralstonia]MBY4703729.1 hypothetical protein [Ralstonia insidiosa]GAQ31288.1 hypothetical protein SAMD00023378_4971 [Ralstonia sp. NT80]
MESIEQALRKSIRDKGRTLKTLGAREALGFATDFYANTPVSEVRDGEGDGLVAYFAVMQRKTIVFEFGINRVLRAPITPKDEDSCGWTTAKRLRLSVGYKPDLDIFRLPPSNSLWVCWCREDLVKFAAEIEASAAFRLVTEKQAAGANIALEAVPAPIRNANHPTAEMTWAFM